MEMIAEMHVSSPPAAFDYHRQKAGSTTPNFKIRILIWINFSGVTI